MRPWGGPLPFLAFPHRLVAHRASQLPRAPPASGSPIPPGIAAGGPLPSEGLSDPGLREQRHRGKGRQEGGREESRGESLPAWAMNMARAPARG